MCSLILYFTAMLALSLVLANQEKCLNSVSAHFSWRCSLDAQYEKFNPISFDMSTTEKQQIVIGIVGEAANNEEQTLRMEIAHKRCMSEFGNDRYFEDPMIANRFPNITLFKQWIRKIIEDTLLANSFTSVTDQVIENGGLYDHKLKDRMFQMLQKFCQKPKYANFLGSMCSKTLPVIDICSKKYCQKLKAEGEIQGSCRNGFDLRSDRDLTFEQIFSINPFVSLCLSDEWFVCQKGVAKVFKDVNAFTSINSGFVSFASVENAVVENNFNNKEYNVINSAQDLDFTVIQPIKVLPNLTLDNATNFVWNLEITGNGAIEVLFGIVDISEWKLDYIVWEDLVYAMFQNAIGFYFDPNFNLITNIDGKYEMESSKYGERITSGEKIKLIYNAGEDSVSILRDSYGGVPREIIRGWSTFSNTNSTFHVMLECHVSAGEEVGLKMIE